MKLRVRYIPGEGYYCMLWIPRSSGPWWMIGPYDTLDKLYEMHRSRFDKV